MSNLNFKIFMRWKCTNLCTREVKLVTRALTGSSTCPAGSEGWGLHNAADTTRLRRTVCWTLRSLCTPASCNHPLDITIRSCNCKRSCSWVGVRVGSRKSMAVTSADSCKGRGSGKKRVGKSVARWESWLVEGKMNNTFYNIWIRE